MRETLQFIIYADEDTRHILGENYCLTGSYGDYLTVAKGIDPATGRLLLSITFAAGLPAFMLSGRLADSVPNVPLLLTVASGFVVSVIALTVVTGVYAIAAVSIVMGFFIHSLFPVVDTYLLSSLPDRHRASAYSLFSAITLSIEALGAVTVGALVTRGIGDTVAFRLIAVVVGVVIGVLSALQYLDRLPTDGRGSGSTVPEPGDVAQ